MKSRVQGAKSLSLPNELHQSTLITARDKNAIRLQDEIGHRAAIGCLSVWDGDRLTVPDTHLRKYRLVSGPSRRWIRTGRTQHPNATARSTAQLDKALKNDAVLQLVFSTPDDHQPPNPPSLRKRGCPDQTKGK